MILGINYVSYECEGSPSGSNLLILPCPGEPVNWRKRTVYDGSILSVTGGGRCVQDWDARWINAVYYWGGQDSRPSPSGSTLLAAYGE
jgi:hypothetical protein